MTQPSAPLPSREQLVVAFRDDLAAAWAAARRKHPDHTPYAFVLWGIEGGRPPMYTPCVLTEESLTEVARRYVDRGYHDTLDRARTALRYRPADSPHLPDLMTDPFPSVLPLLRPVARQLDDDTGYALLAEAAIPALQELDAVGLFGTGPARDRLLLVIITEDVPKDWSQESARRLNPPHVYEPFAAATRPPEGQFTSADALAIAPDGRSLYIKRSRKVPGGAEPPSVNGLVAYDLLDDDGDAGAALSPRWAFEFPSRGDSIRAVACAPDGRSVLALRTTYVQKGVGRATLLRFPRDADQPLARHEMPGEAAGLALSPDGSRIAVALHDKTLHLFDADFRPLASHTLPDKITGLVPLPTGQVLLATAAAVLRVDPAATDAPAATALPLPAAHLATDAGRTLLAVTRPRKVILTRSRGRTQEPTHEFGVDLFYLPSLEPIRTVGLPGHQVSHPALSPDGRLLAAQVHQLDSARQFLAVFDTATGRELARHSSELVHDWAFLPNHPALAIAFGGIMTTEPIEFWPIP